MFSALFLLAATLATTPPIPLDQAKRAFEELRLASEEDAGKLWGQPLNGPTIFVDPQTRFAVANVADAEGKLKPQDGVYTGTIDQSVILANTATTWRGTRWTMVLWGAVSSRTVPRRRLLLHESFHRVQAAAGFPAANAVSPHLDTLEGRYWMQLELRALAAALRATGDARALAIGDALAFRKRHRMLTADADENERRLENNEGLAEYTGWALRGTTDAESRAALAQKLSDTDPTATFSRSFAYSTGPAYGFLLDIASHGWTRRYRATDDLATVLAAAAKITPTAGVEQAALRYGGAELRAAEVKRDAETRENIARYRALLIDGPVLELPMGAFGFDPYTVTGIPGSGTVYGTFEVTGEWGSFKTETGALMTDGRVFVPASAKDSPDLKIAAGWKIVAGNRPGDYRLTH